MVAQKQTAELLDVLERHMLPEEALLVLEDMRGTEAYKRNASFRETMDGLHRVAVERMTKRLIEAEG